MKKLTSLILALMFLFASVSAAAPIYSLYDETNYIDGLKITHIRSLTKNGWLNINIASADLNKDYIDAELLKDENDIRKLTNVKTLAEKADTFVAVNGDFFSWSSAEKGKGSPVGVEIKDGEKLTSYAQASTSNAVFVKTDDKHMLFDYIDTYMTVTAPNGEGVQIKHINKYDDLDGIVMYNSKWGETSPGSYAYQVEMVVEDDTVTAINYDAGPCKIPENGYVLSFLKDRTTFLLDNFQIGDKIVFDISLKPNYENINLAMGGGTLLVKDGKTAKNTHNISGLNPRTALGLDKDGKTLYLITVDGRQADSVGVSLDELSEILINNGIYNAINLDGGGSTTMVAKNIETGVNEVVNLPSEGSLRSVINGIGIKMTAQKGEAAKMVIKPASDTVFKGTSSLAEAFLYDQNGMYLGKALNDEVEWSCENGRIEDGFYYPENEGTGRIFATYQNGIEASADINVLGDIAAIYPSTKSVKLNIGEKQYISLEGCDKSGRSAPINLKDTDINYTDDVFTREGNNLVGAKTGSAIMTIACKNVNTHIALYCGVENDDIPLPEDVSNEEKLKEISPDENSFYFTAFGSPVAKNTLLESAVVRKLNDSAAKMSEIAVFAGNRADTVKTKIKSVKTDVNEVYEYKNCLFISVNNYNGTISGNGFSQWQKIISALDGATSKNVFLILREKPVFTSKNEQDLFDDLLENYLSDKSGKRGFVIYDGEENSVYAKNGVKYFELKGVRGADVKTFAKIEYFIFAVDGDTVTYGLKKIFE
ncbi:MAG: phosphodiester glycosidase family protein [Clostridia bacterium]|nr:phosphodiester glycosidase family protein [Clostridia bacterium]